MAATNRNSAAKARKLENQSKALELRRMGMGYTEISQRLDCSVSTAHGYVAAAMLEVRQQVEADAVELRAEEVSRMDAMLRGLWPDARKGHHGAVDRVLKIMERRAKLLGLDAPARVAHGGDGDAPPIQTVQTLQGLTDADLERIIAAGSAGSA